MKSATLLMKAHQFEQAGCKVFLFKPAFDNRDYGEIRSRAIQYGRECILFNKDVNLVDLVLEKVNINTNNRAVLFFDEILDSSLDDKSLNIILNFISEHTERENKAVYIISHKSGAHIPHINEIITVEKVNGFTRRITGQ
jgi:thymidine kinase